MKRIITFYLVMFTTCLFSQVGIGTLTPNESSQLDIVSDSKGILIPRVNIDDLSTANPVESSSITESLLVYNINITTGKGFYFWDGTKWVKIIDQENVDDVIGNSSDNQEITNITLDTNNNLIIEIENGGSNSVDLSSLVASDEVNTGAGTPESNNVLASEYKLYYDTTNGSLYGSNGSMWQLINMSGNDGASAYQVWLDAGNTGTEADFLASLQGANGAAGADGSSAYQVWLDAGNTGTEADFLASLQGANGAAGADGSSAYQVWLDAGNTGTEADFLASLQGADGAAGADGASAYQVWLDAGNTGTEADFLASLQGADGAAGADGNGVLSTVDNGNGTFTINYSDGTSFTTSNLTGPQGAAGADGSSAYQVWLDAGNTGTEADFLASLQGAAGAAGADGADGRTVLSGTLSPTTEGVDGDFYIDTDDNLIYGPKSGGAWGSGTSLVGAAGAAGADGADGRTVLSGTLSPTTEGVDGDFYIDTDDNLIYGPKTGGAWGSGTSLVGAAGADGADGRTVLSGTLSPTTEGVDGDFYIDTDDNLIYGPKSGGAWGSGTSLVGAAGAAGADGADGRTVLSGTVSPTTEGVDGDFYIDTDDNLIYGPKTGGAWGSGTSLVGAAGADGSDGRTVLSGTLSPTTEGVDGDFYIDTDDNLIYGPKTGGAWGSGTSLVGAAGAAGADGRTVLSGTLSPTTEGVDGDFYIDTDDNLIYGPKTGGAWGSGTSLVGAAGAAGADGRTVLSGTLSPTTEGVDGDFYIDTDDNLIYGPKSGGAWGSGTSLVGAAGSDGRTVLSGTVSPTTEGVDGDFYIDTDDNLIYGPKTGGAWGSGTSLVGAAGADGSDGRTVLSGTVSPTTEGVDGDFYIDTDDNLIYGPKTGGAWGSGTSLVGAAGAAGADGSDGRTVLSGTVSPTTEGVDGDFYIDTDDNLIYGPKSGGAWGSGTSLVGATGADGSDGRTVLSGTVSPTTEGVDGDFYIDTDNNLIYGPKTGGAWGSGTSLVGAGGAAGADGSDGRTVLSGTVSPTTEGVDGDFYIDTDDNLIYGPKSGGAWGSGTSLVGAAGADGRTVLSGTVSPTTEGVDGDFYIDTDDNLIYGPKTGGAWGSGTSLVGAAGADGSDGRTVLSGTVSPTTEGVDGDFYIDTDDNLIYGPKTGGAWGSGTSLVGAAGAAGADGSDGRTVLSGTVSPTTEGVDGDFYIDTDDNLIYGPKSGGAWGSGTSLVGAAGADGRTVLSGTVSPTTEGVDGDFYIDTDDNLIYGPKSGGAWGLGTSLVGAAGADGSDGRTVLSGTVSPTTEGVDGDFYIDTDDNLIYGPKTGGAWGSGTSLVGAAGADGSDAALTGIVNPNGSVTGSPGQLYIDTVTGIVYKTTDGTTWTNIDTDNQDISLSGNTISITKSSSTVDLGASTLASDVSTNTGNITTNTTDIASLLAQINRMNSIRVLTNPSSKTVITDNDGTVIIQNTSLVSLGLGAEVELPLPSAANVGNKITVVNRATLIGLNLSISVLGGGNLIKGDGLVGSLLGLNVQALGGSQTVTYQCGLDPDGNHYWFVVHSGPLSVL